MKLRRLPQKIKSRYRGFMTARLLHRLKSNWSNNSSSVVTIGRWKVKFIDPGSLSDMWRLQFLRRYNDFYTTNSSPRILDCGSNIGVSVLRYKELYPSSKIVAFEPDPDIYQILRYNIIANNLSDVEAIEAAVWNKSGTLEFIKCPFNNDTQAGHLNLSQDYNSDRIITVRTVWLGDYIQTPVDFMKLDIEGAELEVLRSCQHLLTNIRQMIVEVHYRVDRADILAELLSILKSSGFKVAIYQYFGPSTYLPFVSKKNSNGDQFPLLWAWQE